MKLKGILEKIPHTLIAGQGYQDIDINAGYCSDLLSRVMAKGPKEGIWITVQTHTNIIAVASLLDIRCIIVPENIEIDSQTVEKAKDEGIVLISSPLTAFEISGKLYAMGIES